MKTARKVSFFAITLLATFMLEVAAAIPCNERIKIVHAALQIIDGTPLMKTQDMFDLIIDINKLLIQEKLLDYKGESYNVKELAEKEKKENLQGPAIQNTLSYAIKHFRDISASYLEKARGNKAQMGTIIKSWADQRKITSSLLLDWSKQSEGQEHEEFKKMVKNFRTLREFLEQLSCFLKDMTASCPKSFKAYKEATSK